MTTFVLRDGKLIEKHLAAPKHLSSKGPSVIRDEMDATRHMATGEIVTSKAKFRQITKATGHIEVGNDTSMLKPRRPIPLDRGQRREAIRQSLYQLRNGR